MLIIFNQSHYIQPLFYRFFLSSHFVKPFFNSLMILDDFYNFQHLWAQSAFLSIPLSGWYGVYKDPTSTSFQSSHLIRDHQPHRPTLLGKDWILYFLYQIRKSSWKIFLKIFFPVCCIKSTICHQLQYQ